MSTLTAKSPSTVASVIPAAARKIRTVAVLGSGVMGSRIACHFANVGLKVVLLDIVPREPNAAEQAAGLSLSHKAVRNRIVNDALQFALKSNPSPIYSKSLADRITTGNFDDDMPLIAQCDWIIEAVIERLDIKQQVFAKVEQYRKAGTLITSNTSGIPINMLCEGRSDDFKRHFCGTHFFNPPRYLKLLEVIPTTHTDPEVVSFFMRYGDLILGKTMVLCNDTPAFIANRVGVFSITAIFNVMQEMGLTVEEVDALTGPITGKPKSATFRTCDVVGLDTMVKVADGVYQNCPDDEARAFFKIPDYVAKMVENNWLGDKSGQGFYKKVKGANGKSEIWALDITTMEYKPAAKPRFESLGAVKSIEKLKDRLPVLYQQTDKGADFLKRLGNLLCQYVSKRVPEIADEIYKIDDAMRAGFGWELGPFEQWDALGVANVVKDMETADKRPAQWIYDMLAAGIHSFYRLDKGKRQAYNPQTKQYETIPGSENNIRMDDLRATQKAVWKNTGATLHHLGDGVLNLEFHTKMNAMGSEILEGVNRAIDIAERDGYKGLVVANDAETFSAGANLAMILMLALEEEYDELDFAIRAFQNTMMRVRYSGIPVVLAPHGLTLGGACEMSMHADKVVASAETYIGLVEVGAGVVPGGGGTKEFALRASDAYYEGDIQIPLLQKYLMNIATAKVATSAQEAFELGIFQRNKDIIVVNPNRVTAEAKRAALELYQAGYTQPTPKKVRVLGKSALGTFYAGIASLQVAGHASEHDALIARKVAYILCGGDLSAPTDVSEQYLLDLERQAFLELLATRKTLERIQSILSTGKPLRN